MQDRKNTIGAPRTEATSWATVSDAASVVLPTGPDNLEITNESALGTETEIDDYAVFLLADAGWRVFLRDWRRHLQGRHGTAFSVMTAAIMERFLQQLGYRILVKDDESVPRDCVWICQGPA